MRPNMFCQRGPTCTAAIERRFRRDIQHCGKYVVDVGRAAYAANETFHFMKDSILIADIKEMIYTRQFHEFSSGNMRRYVPTLFNI